MNQVKAQTTDRFLGEIVEDIEIKDLVLFPHSTIIYHKANLNEEFELLITTYKYVPKVVYNELDCVRIKFDLDGLDIVMSADPNRKTSINTWRDVKQYCDNLNIKFSNQSFVSVLREERDRFFAIERLIFNKKQRRDIYSKSNQQCNHCKKALELSGMEIDHIKPLASGGDNSYDNLQVLCKPCHFVKTQHSKRVLQFQRKQYQHR